MVDTVIKGTGNSRSIKAAPATLPLTYDEFRAQFISSGISIDLLGLNAAGLTTKGTDLNKGTLFSDAAAANFGLGANGTPDQAFKQLYRSFYGTYSGTGNYGSADYPAVTLTLPFIPKILIVSGGSEGIGVFNADKISVGNYSIGWYVFLHSVDNEIYWKNRYLYSKRVGNTISWYVSQSDNNQFISNAYALNWAGTSYTYFGFI